MKIKTAKRWFLWHKWTSLICTVFLLLLCLTGLPLIFHEEIEHFSEEKIAQIDESKSKLRQDELVKIAEAKFPGKHVRYAFWDYEEHPGQVLFNLSENPKDHYDKSLYLQFDEYTGDILEQAQSEGFMYIMYRLHTDVFAGIPGKLFMGLMGILFIISIVSGIVLYGPIMKKYDFGMVRKNKKRLKWLDTHNLLGIVMVAWMMVVGLTGVINAMADLVIGYWQQDQLAEMTLPYKDSPQLTQPYSSLDDALELAVEIVPDWRVSFVAYPGTDYSSNHHYAVFMVGKSELTERIYTPVLIDAENGSFTDFREMPWYAKTLFVSEPLHFGDYGGIPLKVIWAIFDIFSIIILITGLYLWWQRRKNKVVFKPKKYLDR
jgi:uncharacterized iron-regulated membrane protein